MLGGMLLLTTLGSVFVFYVRSNPLLSNRFVDRPRSINAIGKDENQSLYYGTASVKAGRAFVYNFTVESNMEVYDIDGEFHVVGGEQRNFEVAVASETEFHNWIGGREAKLDYLEDGALNGKFTVAYLAPGRYIFALRSKSSHSGDEDIFLDLQAHWDHPPKVIVGPSPFIH